MQKYRTKKMVSSLGKAVLITVYATVLSADSKGAQQLVTSATFVEKMHVLEMDVTNDTQVLNAYRRLQKDLESCGDKLWALVNNAGLFSMGNLEWGTLDTFNKVFSVNVFGMVRVTRAFLPLIKQSRGRVVNMVSLGGRFTFDLGGVYCMTKHTNIAFSDALRREMHKFGVTVCTIEPGLFMTPMTTNEYISQLLQQTWNQSSDEVKKSYGNSYLESQRKIALNFQNHFKAGVNIDLVVDDMVDAIQNAEPQIIYRPVEGLQSKLSCLMPVYIPSLWLDHLTYANDKSRPEGALKY
ncbi:unnamed protein product [Oppiella nova]|uniref:Uncharacterized protein n=1 Tax=Oppiella nova TaxID=334625 RepID=A0A7R9LSY9_9ACAR|nr:unnamed protein product [Oppiella nova]CAG2166630.1 unnamed protein product [Oppiella nova]